MRRALSEAAKGRGLVEPNPLVGAILVKDDRIVGVGHHARYGGPHAEIAAIRDAGDQACNSTLFVTLEPCCHTGKTPPCTEAILAAGIKGVIASMRDPFPQVDGGGVSVLRSAGVPVALGLEASSAIELNAPYLKLLTTGLPYVIAKWAMTLDGKAATGSGDSKWISSARSRSLVHELRGRMDGILVGLGTILADDPLLTARPPGPRRACRIVVDSLAQLPESSRLVQSARDDPVLVAVSGAAPMDRCAILESLGCTVLRIDSSPRVDLRMLMSELGHRRMTNLLIEGGGRVLGSLLDEGLVDEAEVYIAPLVEGGDHARTPARGWGSTLMGFATRLETGTISEVDGDVRFRGIFPNSWRTKLTYLAREPTRGVVQP